MYLKLESARNATECSMVWSKHGRLGVETMHVFLPLLKFNYVLTGQIIFDLSFSKDCLFASFMIYSTLLFQTQITSFLSSV